MNNKKITIIPFQLKEEKEEKKRKMMKNTK